MMNLTRTVAAICSATAIFSGFAQAQTPTDNRWIAQGPIAQAPADPGQADPKLQALQAAIDAKDTTAIFNLLSQTPRDQRGPMAALLLAAAQSLVATDRQFAASLAALAVISGGLTGVQQANAIAVIRTAPGGLAIVANLLSTSPTGGFGFSNVTTTALVNLVVTENQNQTQTSPN